MFSQNPWIAMILMLSAGITGLSYLIAIVYAALQTSRHRVASMWLLLGLSIWLFSFLTPMLLNIVMSKYFGLEAMQTYGLFINLGNSILHGMGLGCMVIAVFTHREFTQQELGQRSEATLDTPTIGKNTDNPFASPKSK